jgi:hypothetical protein
VGSPGTMLAAGALHELTGEERWLDLWRESAAWLRGEWDPESDLWTQQLYGSARRATRAELGRGRYTLWTGDPGTALYLADCLDGSFGIPLP